MRDRFELLVFDWDGTVLDSVTAIVDCTRATMIALGRAPLEGAAIRDLIGLGLRETVEAMCPGCDEELYLQVLETYRSLWIKTYRHRPRPISGVPEALAALSADGYLMAVATAKTRRGLEHDFESSGLGGHFHASRTVDEALSKPHPQMILDLLEELGALPRRTLMIGDTLHDLQMAGNAGVTAVAVTSGAQPRAVLESLSPAACLETVAHLPEWLQQVG